MNDYGFGMLARAEALRGSSTQWVQRVCELAWIEGAPRDAVARVGRAWVRAGQVTDPIERMGLALPQVPKPLRDAATVSVAVRWTQVHHYVVNVPQGVATTGRAVVAWLNADHSWMNNPAMELHSTPFVNEVTMPQNVTPAPFDEAELDALARTLRTLARPAKD